MRANHHADHGGGQQSADFRPIYLAKGKTADQGRGAEVGDQHEWHDFRQREAQGQQGDGDEAGAEAGNAAHEIGEEQHGDGVGEVWRGHG